MIRRTASAPASSAMRSRSEWTAGREAAISGMKPSAAARQAMVEAVPMTPQVPEVVASLPSISPIRSAETVPARYCAQ